MSFIKHFAPDRVIGVDFSGAAKAGLNTWIAETEVDDDRLRLRSLAPLVKRSGSADRERALAWLVDEITESGRSMWGIDFPFSLPSKLDLGPWEAQLEAVSLFEEGAPEFGRRCVEIALERAGRMHVRRQTDVDSRTPFDCYHYRIVYQMFHGMRDVLRPLSTAPEITILPFQHAQLRSAKVVIAEACPSTTLKRWGVPHQRYKQSGGRPVTPEQRNVRLRILRRVTGVVELTRSQRETALRDPGGDALDALVAAAGLWETWQLLGPATLTENDHYATEGLIFA